MLLPLMLVVLVVLVLVLQLLIAMPLPLLLLLLRRTPENSPLQVRHVRKAEGTDNATQV